MKIKIKESNTIKEQDFELTDKVSIVYGYNNSGKTTILKLIETELINKVKENYFKSNSILSIYIPTNRVIVSNSKVRLPQINDFEELIKYKIDIQKGYDQHLKTLRDYLLKHRTINIFLYNVIKDLFCIELPKNDEFFIENQRYSDGIENIINIYLNIIWILTWNVNINELSYSDLSDTLKNKRAYILIDEIEMFLHVNIQAKLIEALKKDFSNCGFILTTHSPLLLTRYENTMIYNIKNGMLNLLDKNLFYQDLDKIFEVYFHVDELPEQVKKEIDYLWNVITKEESANIVKIKQIEKLLEEEYPNLLKKYNSMILKAKFIGENHV